MTVGNLGTVQAHDEATANPTGQPLAPRTFWRRRSTIIGVATILVVALPFAYDRYWPNDAARSVDADEALDRFRNDTSVPGTAIDSTLVPVADTTIPAAVVTTPEPGVYRYATEGSESVDILGGTTHVYPAETLLTVVDRGCGALLRWDVLRERFDEWNICATPEGITWQPTDMVWYHEFFGSGRREPAACDRAALVVPADFMPLAPQALDCTCDNRPWPAVWEVLGSETRVIEGVEVPVMHVRMTIDWVGELYERTVNDWWFAATGLPVAMTSTKESRSDSGVLGAVTYTETYSAELLSLTPMT